MRFISRCLARAGTDYGRAGIQAEENSGEDQQSAQRTALEEAPQGANDPAR